MMVYKCIKCGVELTDDNWYSSHQKQYQYICKKCSYEKSVLWKKENPANVRLMSERSNRIIGNKPFDENRECSLFLGVHVAEELLCQVFNNVVRMPMNNPGYDFVCGNGYLIDSKCSCLTIDGRWIFGIRRNTTADFFICSAFDNRTNLIPLHAWMLPGKEFNHFQCLSISPSTINRLDDYKINVSKLLECCDMMKGDNNV